jgi:uncharacterized protein (TIGR02569 family)
VSSLPPPGVIEAFRASGRPTLLVGGQGVAWRVGDLVFKPVGNREEHDWVCGVYTGWASSRVRVPQPVRAATGGWSIAGWGAHVYLPGETARVGDDPLWFRAAADDFLDAIAGIPAPQLLSRRDDPWTAADRLVAERARSPDPVADFVDECLPAADPDDGTQQLVHGDLSGNVLRHGDVPAVIDWPAYLWPRSWALAVVIVDALCWERADERLLAAWPDVDESALRRALVWRVVTRSLREPDPDLSRERATLALVERCR